MNTACGPPITPVASSTLKMHESRTVRPALDLIRHRLHLAISGFFLTMFYPLPLAFLHCFLMSCSTSFNGYLGKFVVIRSEHTTLKRSFFKGKPMVYIQFSQMTSPDIVIGPTTSCLARSSVNKVLIADNTLLLP